MFQLVTIKRYSLELFCNHLQTQVAQHIYHLHRPNPLSEIRKNRKSGSQHLGYIKIRFLSNHLNYYLLFPDQETLLLSIVPLHQQNEGFSLISLYFLFTSTKSENFSQLSSIFFSHQQKEINFYRFLFFGQSLVKSDQVSE